MIEEVTYYQIFCDDCEGDPMPAEQSLNDAEQEAMRQGWEIITPFYKHRCNVCVEERTEQERVAPLMARDVILGPFPENGGIDPAYGVVPSLIEAS